MSDEEVKENGTGAEEGGGEGKMPSPEELLGMIFAGMETRQVLGVMFGILGEKAWENLGLKLPYGKKEECTDLDSAKIAIDTLEFITGKIGDKFSAEEKKFADNLVAQLQINYVTKSAQREK
ncbi:MAG: DUF1844 domain-containing protein [Abditibacteriota bacterium]|nr:DUF1844 domain-containing protein [Abditibacteriota bacterium]